MKKNDVLLDAFRQSELEPAKLKNVYGGSFVEGFATTTGVVFRITEDDGEMRHITLTGGAPTKAEAIL